MMEIKKLEKYMAMITMDIIPLKKYKTIIKFSLII